jgi:Ion channel
MSRRRLRAAALGVGLGVCAVVIALFAGNGNAIKGATSVANGLLVALAPAAVVVGVLRSVRAHRAITPEAVAGVLCLYLLAGMFFAFVYGAMNNFGGDPFFASGVEATPSRCLYFSFITLTTVGYGDFVARTSLGHTLSAFEALLGQIYLVTVVAVIVSNVVPRRRRA